PDSLRELLVAGFVQGGETIPPGVGVVFVDAADAPDKRDGTAVLVAREVSELEASPRRPFDEDVPAADFGLDHPTSPASLPRTKRFTHPARHSGSAADRGGRTLPVLVTLTHVFPLALSCDAGDTGRG